MAGDTPIQLHPRAADSGVIDHLLDVLERARAGEVTGMVLVYHDREHGTCTGITGAFDRDEVLGVIERMNHRLLLKIDEEIRVVRLPPRGPDEEPTT